MVKMMKEVFVTAAERNDRWEELRRLDAHRMARFSDPVKEANGRWYNHYCVIYDVESVPQLIETTGETDEQAAEVATPADVV